MKNLTLRKSDIYKRKLMCMLILLILSVTSCHRKNELPDQEVKWLVIKSMQFIWEQENEYREKYGRYGSLMDMSNAGLIDPKWASGEKFYYRWEIIVTADGTKFDCHAFPIKRIKLKSYIIAEDKTIYGDNIHGKKASRELPVIDLNSDFAP